MNFSDKLPTVGEAQMALVVINSGRVAIGLDPVERLDFDACTPGSTTNCLSARHLFEPANITVTGTALVPYGFSDTKQTEKLFEAIGATETDYSGRVRIPEAIRRLTDPFDDEALGLRERLVEAGVV